MPTWKPKAVEDLNDITAYIAQDNPRAAVETVDMLMQKAGQLDEYPELGRTGRVRGTRELVAHPNYILIYRLADGAVEVLRVKHAARRWP